MEITPRCELFLLLATAFTFSGCSTPIESVARPIQVHVRALSVNGERTEHIFDVIDHRTPGYGDISSVEAAQEMNFAIRNFSNPELKARLGATEESFDGFPQVVSSVGGLVPVNAIRKIGSEKVSGQIPEEGYSSMSYKLAFALSGTFNVNEEKLIPVFRADCGSECAQEDEWQPLPRPVMSVDLANLNAVVGQRCGAVFRYIICDLPQEVYGFWVRESMSGRTLSEILIVDARKIPRNICSDVHVLSTTATFEPDSSKKIQSCFKNFRAEALK